MKRLREGGEGEGLRDVVVEREKEELTCPAVCPPVPLVFHPCGGTILLTSSEFKQLSFCEVIPNALK